jgi:hypothetical protein
MGYVCEKPGWLPAAHRDVHCCPASYQPTMHRLTSAIITALFSFGIAHGATTPKPPPPVLVVSDVLAGVPDDLRPQPGKPITYAIAGKFERNIGATVGGEARVDAATIDAEVTKILNSQGFVKTTVGGPMPKIAILITWGSAILDTSELSMLALPGRVTGGPVDQNDPTDPNRPADRLQIAMNQREISQLVGADKAANDNSLDPHTVAKINEAAASSRLYVFIAAYDMQALVATKEKKLLWRTRISIPSTRHSLPESLDVMLASAGPYLGREVAVPLILGEADRRKTDVHVGLPYVVPDKEQPGEAKKSK